MPFNPEECRRKATSQPTSSPYFKAEKKDDTEKNVNLKEKLPTMNNPRKKRKRSKRGMTSSRYFATSPSSAVSSVLSLGSFLSTLTYEKIKDCEDIKHKSKLDKAASHFQHCSIFAKSYSAAVAELSLSSYKQSNTAEDDDAIVEEEREGVIHQSVRHVCPHGCYLRAYAAVREWHCLRASIYELSGCSPDRILKGWKCYLLPPHSYNRGRNPRNRNDGDLISFKEKSNEACDMKQNKECESCLSHLARVVFAAPNGEAFPSSNGVLRRLAIVDDTPRKKGENPNKIVSISDSAYEQPLSKRRRRHVVEIGFGNISCIGSQHSIIEAEILHGEIMHGNSQPNNSGMEKDTATDIQRILKMGQTELMQRSYKHVAASLQNQTKIEQCSANSRWANINAASPFGLLEELFVTHPWRLLLSTILLNKTSRAQADPVLLAFFRSYPDAKSTANGDAEHISKLTAPLGLMHKRARAIIRFSREYLELIERKSVEFQNNVTNGTRAKSDQIGDKSMLNTKLEVNSLKRTRNREGLQEEFHLTVKEVLGLYNCGQYSADAYQIFIQRHYNIPISDYALKMYADYQQGRRKILSSMDNKLC